MPVPYTVKVAGVTFGGRQEVLAGLFQSLNGTTTLTAMLKRESENPYDANAIKVVVAGEHIGYVPGFLAAKLAPRMDAGERVVVTATGISRCTEGFRATIEIDIASEEAV